MAAEIKPEVFTTHDVNNARIRAIEKVVPEIRGKAHELLQKEAKVYRERALHHAHLYTIGDYGAELSGKGAGKVKDRNAARHCMDMAEKLETLAQKMLQLYTEEPVH